MTNEAPDDFAAPADMVAGVGGRLRAARIDAGLDISDIASRTRIPQRHLEAIEAGDFAALPSTTYATGFAKAFARAVDLDEVEVAREVRDELASSSGARDWQPYETADPKRVPPRILAWTGAVVALLVIAGFGWWYANRTALPPETIVTTPGDGATIAAAPGSSSGGAPVEGPTPGAAGPVVLTANQPVWLRITDAAGTRLLEREMQAGERFEVPATATTPTLLTGRPEALDATVGGQRVAPLGPAGRSVSDVVLTAEALTNRAAPTDIAAPPTP